MSFYVQLFYDIMHCRLEKAFYFHLVKKAKKFKFDDPSKILTRDMREHSVQCVGRHLGHSSRHA